jgi:death on curing protein
MKEEPLWLQRDVVIALQERLVAEFGGAAGLRDVGLLDSALARAQHRLAYNTPTIFELAASYAFELIHSHPFVDGNKRIGLVAAVTFLEINSCRFTASEIDAVIHTLALAAGEMDEAAYATWLAQNSTRT